MIRLLAYFHCLVELVVCIVYNRLVRHEITAYMISLVCSEPEHASPSPSLPTGGNSHTVHGSERCEMRRAVRQNAFAPPAIYPARTFPPLRFTGRKLEHAQR
jgi:hypothetical protein